MDRATVMAAVRLAALIAGIAVSHAAVATDTSTLHILAGMFLGIPLLKILER